MPRPDDPDAARTGPRDRRTGDRRAAERRAGDDRRVSRLVHDPALRVRTVRVLVPLAVGTVLWPGATLLGVSRGWPSGAAAAVLLGPAAAVAARRLGNRGAACLLLATALAVLLEGPLALLLRAAWPAGWGTLPPPRFDSLFAVPAAAWVVAAGGWALGQVRRLSEVEAQARTDSLTGLLRRGPFERRLTDLLARLPADEPVAVIMADLDQFKRFNDEYGHPAGDAALRHVADLLRDLPPPGSPAARYGGEEFVVAVPHFDAREARELAERLRAAVARGVSDDGRVLPLTASFGVAGRGDSDDPVDLFRRADAALYRAKDSGRNRVEGRSEFRPPGA